ncbi:unnamed protein product [Rotaria sordida]|uniref:EF-hand domain-containing protein n=2 Tax=Rotaria sordida TaxID=392033 RepID=A0A815FIP2_9BILA|nr:unnamed protein product [Rotaria sordida]
MTKKGRTNINLTPNGEIFHRININDDGTIDFNQLLLLIPIRKKLGNLEQRLTFLFDLWDDSERWTNLSKITNLFNISYG